MPYTRHTQGTMSWYTWEEPKPRKKAVPSITHQIESPEGRNSREGDCAIRAISRFFELPYAEVRDLMMRDYGYRPRGGVTLPMFDKFAKDFGLKFVEAHIRLNSATAKDKLPNKAILLFRRHVAAYESGTIFDLGYTANTPGMKQTKGYYVKA